MKRGEHEEQQILFKKDLFIIYLFIYIGFVNYVLLFYKVHI